MCIRDRAVGGVFALRYFLDRRTAQKYATRASLLRASPWLLLPAVVWVIGKVFNATFGVQTSLLDTSAGGGQTLFERIAMQFADYGPEVASFYWGYLLDSARSRWLPWLLFGACMVAAIARPRAFFLRPEALALAVFLLGAAGYMLVFVGTNAPLTWHLRTAADRTMLHVLPLAVLGICAATWGRDPVDVASQ